MKKKSENILLMLEQQNPKSSFKNYSPHLCMFQGLLKVYWLQDYVCKKSYAKYFYLMHWYMPVCQISATTYTPIF